MTLGIGEKRMIDFLLPKILAMFLTSLSIALAYFGNYETIPLTIMGFFCIYSFDKAFTKKEENK